MAVAVAICPGSFDPITIGHVDIVGRASKMFDKVIMLTMVNRKKVSLFTPEERVDFMRRATAKFPNVEVDFFDGLLADYAKEKGAIAIVKGLRALSDFDDEFKQALANKKIAPGVETIFLVTSAEHMFLSSSVVKEIGSFGGDIGGFVPPEIKEDIIKLIRERCTQ